jgi:ATP-dependent DNA ligase
VTPPVDDHALPVGRFKAPLRRTRATRPCRHARSRCTETAGSLGVCGRARAVAWRVSCAPRNDDRSASSLAGHPCSDHWRSRVPARNREIRTPRVGSGWLHEIKHDGYRRDPVGIRLITRRGNDWTQRFPLVVEAVNHLKVRSCLIDGEVVCCDAQGVTSFQLLRHRRNEAQAFL